MAEVEMALDPQGLAREWGLRIKSREKDFEDRFWQKAEKTIDRYWDERSETHIQKDRNKRKYNILWSNTELLEPAVFNRIPEPVVSRRWKDNKPVARTAAEVLQRAVTYNFERDDVDFVDHMKATVWNLLVPGMGQLWLRYDPSFSPSGFADEAGDPIMAKADEKVAVDYVHWKDFLFSKGNVWSQVWWVARKVRLWPVEVAARFGPEAAASVQTSDDEKADNSRQSTTQDDRTDKRVLVYEIWDKRSKTVIWYTPKSDRVLDVKPDPLKLGEFFPCPKPILGITTTDDCMPKPIFCMYQDQAAELDEMTARIYVLQDACKVVGVYNAEMGDDFKQMLSGNKNELIPIRDWNTFAKSGAVDGNVVWLPLDRVVQMLTTLYQSREQVKRDIYELLGVADIMRGVSDPLDAEGTNQLKAQWGSIRVRDWQRDIQRFCRDVMAIAGEIIAEQFSPQTIMLSSGVQLPTMQQKAQVAMTQGIEAASDMVTGEDVISLIRNDKMRGFALDIETDSTLEPDEAEEKTKRVEFGKAVADMFGAFGPIVKEAPEFNEAIKETFMFILAAFSAGRQLEGAYEQAFEQLQNRPAQPPQPTPDAMLKSQTDLQKTQIQEQGDTTRKAMELHAEAEEGDRDRAAKLTSDVLDIAAARESRF